jgi:CheY-like chemotaxis protein
VSAGNEFPQDTVVDTMLSCGHPDANRPLAAFHRRNESKGVGSSAKTTSVILIVEDETLIRWGAVKMAEDAGFKVLEAANADEAIQILETRNDIRVIFTDIHMPGSMDGLKLAHAVRDRWPPIQIIVTSGREYPKKLDLPEGGRFFAKPYTPAQVQSALREWA